NKLRIFGQESVYLRVYAAGIDGLNGRKRRRFGFDLAQRFQCRRIGGARINEIRRKEVTGFRIHLCADRKQHGMLLDWRKGSNADALEGLESVNFSRKRRWEGRAFPSSFWSR
ncbi:MAG: hypothetical protein IJX19_12130, partial [Clostridia bacterium]|nr:hypothetical protein [Clostridia bacterium]